MQLREGELAVDQQQIGHRAVLSLTGEIDMSTVGRLRTAIDEAAMTSSDIWVDFTAVTFMDSSGVHALVETHLRLTAASRRLALVCPEGAVLRVLQLTGVNQQLEIHPSRSAAHFAAA